MFSESEIKELRDIVGQKLTGDRFGHTLRVEEEVARMSEIYLPARINELRCAALLHDLTKEYLGFDQIMLCKSLGVVLSDADRSSPQTLHGLSAAALIEREYTAFATDDILTAIRCHTTGDAGMDVFSLILFVADFIESGRRYDACQSLRKRYWDWVEEDKSIRPLLLAAYEELTFTVSYLEQKNYPVAPKTFRAIEDIKMRLESEDTTCL